MFAPIDSLVDSIRSSAKYRHISPDLVRRIGSAELLKRPSLKQAIKSTKSKLHQVGAAYVAGRTPYDRWREALGAAHKEGPGQLQAMCRQIMLAHVSSRERVPIIERFYKDVFGRIGSVNSIIDLACGLNPLALPWMGLPKDVAYRALDIYADLSGFLNDTFAILGVAGQASVQDVLSPTAGLDADLTLLLKALPCLQQIDRGATLELVDRITSPWLVISYPARSIGGRGKGMVETYRADFLALAERKEWEAKELLYDTELVYVVHQTKHCN